MYEAFSFTDGGDSFGVGHTCHQFFIDLEEINKTFKRVMCMVSEHPETCYKTKHRIRD